MSAWQFDGTVCYQSGRKVAFTPVALGAANGSQGIAEVYRTDTDLSGRFQGVLRDGPAAGKASFYARAFDSWSDTQLVTEWVPIKTNGGAALVADIILPWDAPDICKADGQWFSAAFPFVESLVRSLEQPGAMHQALTLRALPLQGDGKPYLSYPADPALDRMFTQFQEDMAQIRGNSHVAMDIARRMSDCLLRTGFAKRYDERIDVFRFALQGIFTRTHEDRKSHIRNLLKTLSISLKRPFVPGNGAVVEVESATAAVAMILYAGAWMSLGRTDLVLQRESASGARTSYQLTVPGASSK
ncbi:hypothetical protein F183_A45240 [Bryobacterales bacterium F-183]|nr:hypothetical protein F183_A45240 [Bryobacterales bacterium F-183]